MVTSVLVYPKLSTHPDEDSQEPILALNQDLDPDVNKENGHVVNQGNGPVENHELNHIGHQEEGLNLNPVVRVSRRPYSVKEKRDIVQAVWTIVANDMSVHQTCAMIGLPHQYYYRFKKAINLQMTSRRVMFSFTTSSMV
jgi:hypothetical protein